MLSSNFRYHSYSTTQLNFGNISILISKSQMLSQCMFSCIFVYIISVCEIGCVMPFTNQETLINSINKNVQWIKNLFPIKSGTSFDSFSIFSNFLKDVSEWGQIQNVVVIQNFSIPIACQKMYGNCKLSWKQ